MSHYRKAIEVIECVQQNMNDERFINWIYKTLGLDIEEVKK
tara:strand:+ start:231 stop:353 length:123 start_codon:yes stop_codon:yes gene_type:complete